MSEASVDPILTNPNWNRSASYVVQVVPHNKRPGDFLARIIVVKEPPQAQAEPHTLFPQMIGCDDISSLHLYIESPEATHQPTELAECQAKSLLPQAILRSFAPGRFRNGCKYFLLRPGQTPPEPVYPVWARDEKRSKQVLAGKYAEITPFSFEFVPTLNCVHRCHECAYRVPKEALGLWRQNDFSGSFHMDLPTMQAILDRLKEADVNEVLYTGGGEPLLNVYTPRAMSYATEIGIPRVGLYTNGALITASKAKALIAAKPRYVRVSVNAGTQEVYKRHHNSLRPAIDYFTRTIAGITFLTQAKYECGSESSIGISYLVDDENASDVVNAARLVAEIAGRYPRTINYMRFTPSVNYFGPNQYEREMFEKTVAQILNEAVPILKAVGVETPVYLHRFRGLYEPRTYRQCLASTWYGGVGPGGIAYWCCEKLFNPDFSFGSLLEQPLAEIWAGPRRKAVGQRVSQAVLGGTDSPCPVVCKPHEHNKVFAEVERLRAAGKIAVVAAWLERIYEIKQRQLREPTLFGFDSTSEHQS